MSVLSSILQHAHAGQTAQPASVLPQAAVTNGTTSTGSSNSSSNAASAAASTISANDFLTLLVTEMQNQDPTSNTDPNEYINQLVQVNSLEQLIDINQTLTTAYPATATASPAPSTNASAQPPLATSGAASVAAKTAQPTAGSSLASMAVRLTPQATAAKTAANSHATGNLGIPDSSPAALRVAHALNGQSRRAAASRPNSLAPNSAPGNPAR